MGKTVVIQSHRSPLPYAWLDQCMDSVKYWVEINGFVYQFVGDEIFNEINPTLSRYVEDDRVIASDLARLLWLRKTLKEGCDRVVWLDADFLIFSSENFILPDLAYAVGREVWVQEDKANNLKVYKKVHNAFLMFNRNNTFLDFYIETAERLLSMNTGGVPAQFIGPKLLTALHNIANFPVMEMAGMLSPAVVKDILNNGGPALDLFKKHSLAKIVGANLCSSSCDRGEITADEMDRLVQQMPSFGIL